MIARTPFLIDWSDARRIRTRLPSALFGSLIAFGPVSGQDPPPPSAPPLAVLDDSLFRPLTFPATDPFGYPPNNIHKPGVIEMARRRDFDGLDLLFDVLQADVARDVRNEYRLLDAFGALDRDDAAVSAGIDAWVAAKPRSAHALVARAEYNLGMGWRRRGGDFIRNTPPDRLRDMERFATRAGQDALAALGRDRAHLAAYAVLLSIAQLGGGGEPARAILTRGLQFHPGSYALRRAYIATLQPVWGGSYTEMIAFAEEAARDSALNPRLLTLRGAVYLTRSHHEFRIPRNYRGAIAELNKAIAYGPEWLYLRERGEAYFFLNDFPRAFLDLRAAVLQRPQDPETLDIYGVTLVQLARSGPPQLRMVVLDRAIETLRLAAYLDPSNADAATWLKYAQEIKRLCGGGQPTCEPPVATRPTLRADTLSGRVRLVVPP